MTIGEPQCLTHAARDFLVAEQHGQMGIPNIFKDAPFPGFDVTSEEQGEFRVFGISQPIAENV
jgi:hypothetical protein